MPRVPIMTIIFFLFLIWYIIKNICHKQGAGLEILKHCGSLAYLNIFHPFFMFSCLSQGPMQITEVCPVLMYH